MSRSDTPLRPEEHPTRPGVYLMKDADGVILYVGKALNLRSRLRSYLRREEESRPQIRFLLERIATVETIVTDTEQEALILENTLIKEHRPRYNIHLRDDKTYVSLRIDLREDFPELRVVRKVADDGALYFGPFASSTALRETLKHIYRIFPLRHYPRSRCFGRQRPCLFYQIGQCSAPCHGKISVADYAELVRGAVALLAGRADEVLVRLREEMRAAAAALRFEEAALLRNRIAAIEQTVEKQKVQIHGGGDCDIFGLFGDGSTCEVAVLIVRKGQLVDRHNYRVRSDLPRQELLTAAVQQFYADEHRVPPQIWTPFPLEDGRLLTEWLTQQRGGKVGLVVPLRGEKGRLVELACRNAEELFGAGGGGADDSAVLAEIAETLALSQLPQRIECFDISHIQGDCTVGSMSVCMNGRIDRREFRRYEVRSLNSGVSDDYAALTEVIGRRLERGVTEGGLPQLIVIDGGKGQLGILLRLLRERGLEELVEAASIAKARPGRVKAGSGHPWEQERFFRPAREGFVTFSAGAALNLLTRLRDEAHRYAILYHREKQRKKLLSSQLATVPGIGETRRLALLKYFGSMKKVLGASVEELNQVPGVGLRLAEQIHGALQGKRIDSEEKIK